MRNNGCPVCGGLGRVLAFGFAGDPVTTGCPECAGLAFTPASADDLAVRRKRRADEPLEADEPN